MLRTLATAAAAVLAVSATAQAVPLTGTFGVTVWQGTNPSHSRTDATQQALPSAIAAIAAHQTYTSSFNYTGALNLTAQSDPTSLRAYFASAGGTTSVVLPTTSLSSGNFADETLIRFSFRTASGFTGSINHDDGISLFAGENTTTNLLPGNSAPTALSSTPVTLAAGSYDLYYIEVNGAPAQINIDITRVPEPASLGLLGLGLVGAGLLRRRAGTAA